MARHNLVNSAPHRPVYAADYSMLLGCKCGQRFEPSDCDDEYASHLVEINKATSR